jgi:hypothetical protein
VQPPAVRHDFGVIPHGKSASHEYEFDLKALQQPATRWVPLRAHIDCSCGSTELLLRKADGSERRLDGRPDPEFAVADDERLLVRLTINTITKDPIDLPHATSRGYLLLQPVGDRDGSRRVQWPFLVDFGIDAPVECKPFAALEYGRVAQSARPELTITLRGDAAHAGTTFGPVRSSSPALVPTLAQENGATVLRVRCDPSLDLDTVDRNTGAPGGDPLGNRSAVIQVDTSLPDYQINLGAKWKVVPDLEASPLPKLSFRADLSKPQAERDELSQFLLVTDHDPSRAPEFVVRKIEDQAGRDASARFAVRLEPIPGSSRQQRMFVRSLGGPAEDFRGRIVLGKPGADQPTLSIELVAFHRL